MGRGERMDAYKYIGTISYTILESNFGTAQWQAKTFYDSPLGTIITLPPMFLTVFGSAGTSLPTTSLYGQQYVAGVNVVRQDYELGRPVFDSDRYIVKPANGYGVVLKERPDNQHHLSPTSELVSYLDPRLQNYIRSTLGSH